MRIVICDDDSLCLKAAAAAVEAWAADRHQRVDIGIFDNGDDLIENLQQKPASLLLLDIFMPVFSGMDIAREIRFFDQDLIIVFLTSSSEFAVESYDVQASGYLLKPLDRSKLCTVLDRCLNDLKPLPKRVILRTAGGYFSQQISEIECVEAQNKTMLITKTNGECVRSTDTLSHLEQNLTLDAGFFKCHRSYLVNLFAVEHFSMSGLVTKSGRNIPIARGYGKAFKDAYFALMIRDQERTIYD